MFDCVLNTRLVIFDRFFSNDLISDESEVRNLVVWLEDKKIRFYQPNDREPLRDTESKYWIGALKKV